MLHDAEKVCGNKENREEEVGPLMRSPQGKTKEFVINAGSTKEEEKMEFKGRGDFTRGYMNNLEKGRVNDVGSNEQEERIKRGNGGENEKGKKNGNIELMNIGKEEEA